jgi:hypothetical protein
MAHGCANAIIASIPTANNNDILAFGINVAIILKLGVQKGFAVQLMHIERAHQRKTCREKIRTMPVSTP